MSEKATEYYILMENPDSYFDSDVEKKLKDGWLLYGSPFITASRDHNGLFCQALIRKV